MLRAEGDAPSRLTAGTVRYGLLARSATDLFLARCNAEDIRWQGGSLVSAQAVTNAFHPGTGR